MGGRSIANRLKTLTRGNITSEYNYDADGLIQSIFHKKGLDEISSYLYVRNSIGNVKSVTSNRGTTNYTYNSENFLTSSITDEFTGDYANESFNYDSIGNRSSDNLGIYTHESSKQRLTEDTKYVYFYDNNGNMTSRQEKGMTGNLTNYIYSSENQLIKIEKYEDNIKLKTVSYHYDALGRRMQKEIIDHQNPLNSFKRKYFYNGDDVLAEYDEDDELLAVYTHSEVWVDDILSIDAVDQKIASDPGTYYYLKDAGNSIKDIANSSGLVQSYDYSSFGKLVRVRNKDGNEITSNPLISSNYSYTGREYDTESGMYFYRSRFYQPEIGRFIQEDPYPGKLSDPISHINKYTYVGNNPVNYIDPYGEAAVFSVGQIAISNPVAAIIVVAVVVVVNYANQGVSDQEAMELNMFSKALEQTPAIYRSDLVADNKLFQDNVTDLGSAFEPEYGSNYIFANRRGNNKGERNYTGNSKGTKNPFKHYRPAKGRPGWAERKNPQTGKKDLVPIEEGSLLEKYIRDKYGI